MILPSCVDACENMKISIVDNKQVSCKRIKFTLDPVYKQGTNTKYLSPNSLLED